MKEKSDTYLVREYAENGSDSAFAEIVARYTDLVYSAALRQGGSPDAAMDVAQRVFTDLARKARSLAGRMKADTSLVGWLTGPRATQHLPISETNNAARRVKRRLWITSLLPNFRPIGTKSVRCSMKPWRISMTVTGRRCCCAFQAKAAPSDAAGDSTAELDKLRSAVQALQNETNEITKRLVEQNPRQPLPETVKQGATSYTVGLKSAVVADAGSEEYDRHLYSLAESNRGTADARNLGSALRKYARAQGEFPANFYDAADYLYKDQPAPEYGNFESVYQGSLNDLTNIPRGAVALIRQRQPWQTPRGKLARVYTMADGNLQVVESDDNFQAWEAEHIIPPASPAD